MLRNVLLFFTAVFLSLTAGRAFWVWLGESPFGVTGATYVDFFQQVYKRIAVPIAIIGVAGPILAACCAAVHRASRPMFYFFVAAFGLGVVGVLVTVVVNVPINQTIARWNPAALPSGYEDALRQRWSWHIVRLVTSVGAMCSVFAALIIGGAGRHQPG
jgi:hypothetical protein